jgi:hypothetical protein
MKSLDAQCCIAVSCPMLLTSGMCAIGNDPATCMMPRGVRQLTADELELVELTK